MLSNNHKCLSFSILPAHNPYAVATFTKSGKSTPESGVAPITFPKKFSCVCLIDKYPLLFKTIIITLVPKVFNVCNSWIFICKLPSPAKQITLLAAVLAPIAVGKSCPIDAAPELLNNLCCDLIVPTWKGNMQAEAFPQTTTSSSLNCLKILSTITYGFNA